MHRRVARQARAFITVDDLKNGLSKANLTVKKGDTFLYWQNYYARKDQPNWLHEFAGLNWDAAQWLADQGVVNIGCECASIDSSDAMPDDAKVAFPAHRTCRDRGILNTENLANLESVVGDVSSTLDCRCGSWAAPAVQSGRWLCSTPNATAKSKTPSR